MYRGMDMGYDASLDWGMEPMPNFPTRPTEVVPVGRRKLIMSGVEGKICAPWTAERFAPMSSAISKNRKSSEASRTPEACTACKRIKKKCDDLRPCSRCVRLGRGGQCSSWTKDESASPKDDSMSVERPVSLSSSSLACNPDRSFPRVTVDHDLVCEAIMKVWSFGLRLDSVVNIFSSIPPDVFPIVKKFFGSPPNAPALIENGTPFPPNPESDSTMLSEEDSCLVTDAERWENDEVYGFLELVFDPGSAKLWRNVGMNARYAEIHGYHKEEMLARYARHEADLQRTERDALFFFLFTFKNILNGGGPAEIYSRIFTGAGDEMRASLVWVTMGNVFNHRGQLTKLTVLIKTITAEEYDEAVRRTPHACVLWEMGDRRCGQELLDSIQVDAGRTVAQLGQLDEDEDLIRRLAEL